MSLNIAIVGATGNVGREMLNILSDRKYDSSNIFPVASSKSEGAKVEFGDKELTVEAIDKFDPAKADLALFSAGASVSKEWAPKFAEKNCIVIDNSSQFRMDKDIPLIVPEVNPESIKDCKIKNIIERSETILWNGPAGYFENPNFANGSYEIAKAIIKKNKNKNKKVKEIGGPKGPEPTRYGDWEVKGRVSDF